MIDSPKQTDYRTVMSHFRAAPSETYGQKPKFTTIRKPKREKAETFHIFIKIQFHSLETIQITE